MMRTWLLVLAIAASTAASASAARATPDAYPGFDLMLLVRTYPPGYCSSHSCKLDPAPGFTVHGLWPEYDTGGWPQFCHNSRVNSTSPSPDTRSECEWPSLMGPDRSFWDHEWLRHGTCAAPLLGDRDAFVDTVLRLHEKYDLDAALGKAGIVPSDSKRYPVSAVAGAVEEAYGAAPLFNCDGRGVLQELWLCIGLDLEAFACPPRVRGGRRCPPTFLLPSGPETPPACKGFIPDWPGAEFPARGAAVEGALVAASA